jgi:membrane fusion protein, copper/silver efflux system
MKLKNMLVIAMVATLGGGALWVAANHAVAEDATAANRKVLYYTCPMHPAVRADKPGACPICGMNLLPVYDARGATNNAPVTVNTNEPAVTLPGCCAPAGGGCCQ